MATLVYAHDQNGNRTAGDLQALINAVLAGERIRVKNGSEQDGFGLREFSNVYVRNGHVSAQGMQFNWNWSSDGKTIVFEPQFAYYIFNLSTTGRCQRRVYTPQTNTNDDLTYQMGISWYIVG